MCPSMDPQLKLREELKREKSWDPRRRWKVIQDTITWVEAQAPVPRNSKQRCLELQRERLADLRIRDAGFGIRG